MRLQLNIKQTQQQDISGNNIYFQGNNVNTLSPVIGTLPLARQWRNYGSFIDVTTEVSDLFALKLEWTAQADSEGFIAPSTFNPKRGASGTITFEGEAYRLIKQWLVDDVSSQLNSVDIEIYHFENNNNFCGKYTNWVIKATDLEWCEDNICTFDVSFKQKDEAYNCIRSTSISDNWRGNGQDWFTDDTTHPHPRFSYCKEIRPNSSLVMTWYFMNFIVFLLKTIVIPIMFALNGLIFAINGIIFTINLIIAVVNALGGNITPLNPIPFFNASDFRDNLGIFYTEAAGCGREHPAPLIRDYILNVCQKCGVDVDEVTADIFFAQQITIETSSRGVVTVNNPHYRATYLYAPSRKGIRRFLNVSLFGASDPDNRMYIYENRPIKSLEAFLNELKTLYNAEWNLSNNTLYFKRKDFFRQPTNSYILDLSENGADRNRLLQGLCYTWNEKKIPCQANGLYDNDGTDTSGDEAKAFMNDEIKYGDASKNPVYDGFQDKTTRFGATKFRGDGVATDYIMDAFQSIVNSNFLTGTFGGATLFNDVQPILELYADYALLMKDDKTNLPKVIIWDGVSHLNARAEKYYTGIDTFGAEPRRNLTYNSGYGWSQAHPPQTYVRGRTLVFGSQTVGKYEARDLIGVHFYTMIAYLINYPMYMAVGFEDSMWDWFHWIDDPNKRSILLRDVNGKVELCCDLLERFKVFNDARNIALGERILLPDGKDARITNLVVNYDPKEERGQYIEFKAES